MDKILKPFSQRKRMIDKEFYTGDSVICVYDNGTCYAGFYFSSELRMRNDDTPVNLGRKLSGREDYPIGFSITHLMKNHTKNKATVLVIRDNIYNNVTVQIFRTRLVIFEKAIRFKNEIGDGPKFVHVLG